MLRLALQESRWFTGTLVAVHEITGGSIVFIFAISSPTRVDSAWPVGNLISNKSHEFAYLPH
jgi:hypothetical protein